MYFLNGYNNFLSILHKKTKQKKQIFWQSLKVERDSDQDKKSNRIILG